MCAVAMWMVCTGGCEQDPPIVDSGGMADSPISVTDHIKVYHVVSSAATILGGSTPIPFSTQLIVAPTTTAVYPLVGLDYQATITGVDLYMAQTPTGIPTYDIVADNLGEWGFSGFWSLPGTSIGSSGLVVYMTDGFPFTVPGPVSLRIRTDGISSTSLGAIGVHYY